MADTDRFVPGVFPLRAAGPMFKGTKTESRAKVEEKRQSVKSNESGNKTKARQRDDYRCRFPRCGCHARRQHPEVAHCRHKGAGGDPLKLRSTVGNLICLCPDRHQNSRVSFHTGSLKVEPLTRGVGTNGPVRWWVDATAVEKPIGKRQAGDERWVVVAEEDRIGVLKPVNKKQAALLEAIAELKA